MYMQLIIRNETESDYRAVEEVTREAFWNLFVPGCDEHYFAHILRNHPDFIPELDFVAVHEGEVIGNIMYTKSHLIDADDPERTLNTITFGPVSVLPRFQRQGVGSRLIRHSLETAKTTGHTAVIIDGHPYNYCKHGFKASKDYRISDSEGRYPFGLLALELQKGAFDGRKWKYCQSPAFDVDKEAALEFDKGFEPRKKEYRYTQEEFSIACRAYLL